MAIVDSEKEYRSAAKQIDTPQASVRKVLFMLQEELECAMKKHPVGFHTPHEGYAVILEELDELWDLVKADKARGSDAEREAIQIAAMAVRYVLDICRASK